MFIYQNLASVPGRRNMIEIPLCFVHHFQCNKGFYCRVYDYLCCKGGMISFKRDDLKYFQAVVCPGSSYLRTNPRPISDLILVAIETLISHMDGSYILIKKKQYSVYSNLLLKIFRFLGDGEITSHGECF